MKLSIDQVSDLYQRIAKVTTRFTFVLPVALDDIEHVANELRKALPETWLAVRWGFAADSGRPFIGVVKPGEEALYYREFIPQANATRR